jgi:2,3-dihydroxybenzoate-AMP ligase/mycobactin salicyl-AMP ligase
MLEFLKHRARDARQYSRNKWWLGMTLGDILDRTADVFPNREALVDDRVRLTYSELRNTVDQTATGLMNLGIEKGDTVLLQLPNWAEYVYSYFALQKIGGIPVVLISGYRQLEVSHLALLTEAKAWIVPDRYRKIDYVSFFGEVRQKNPRLGQVISVRGGKEAEGFTASLEGFLERKSTPAERHKMTKRKPKATEVAHIIPSGGTTGLPKGIPRTHNDYICNVEYLHKAWEMNTRDVSLVVVPVGHNLALLNVVGAVLMGYKVVLLDSTKPEDICSTIEREKVSFMPTVPSVVRRIVESERLHDYDLSSLKKISAGGEPSAPDLIREVYKQLNCTYINEFGMSEGLLCRTTLTDDIETICGTVGKPCCPYEQIKVVNGMGKILPPDQEGELVTKGPGIFAGYLKNPEENEKSFLGGGFFRTGDQAKIDRSGNLKITGRTKDIIIRGGENISPAMVEELLCSHPGVADAAVIGMPDKELGERVCAYLRLTEGMKVDPEEVKSFMESRGASRLLIPERFEFVDVLPLTEAGKHDKKALREDIKKKIG